MNLKKLLLLSLAVVTSSAALAQGFPGGGPVGPPQGGFMRQNSIAHPEMLVMRRDVQADLKLTDDQKTQLKTLRDSMRPRGGPQGGQPGGGDPGAGGPPPGPPRDGGQAGPPGGGPPGGPGGGGPGGEQFDQMRQKMTEAVQKILTSDQDKRLKEIAIQLAGASAIQDKGVQQSLSLTDDQKSKVEMLVAQQQESNRKLFEGAQNGDYDRQEARDRARENDKILQDQLAKLLTDDQNAKLQELRGKPFLADLPLQAPGGPGGPGAPGGGPLPVG